MPEQKEHTNPLARRDTPDILSATPQKIIRWGMFALVLLVVVSVLLSYLIPYPDILTADITMTSVQQENSRELNVVLTKGQQPEQDKSRLLLLNQDEIGIGTELNIKPANYEDTGMLKGIVSGISKTHRKDSCFITITLPDGFTTSFHKTISYEPGMKGKADVIVKKQSLMHKLISVVTQRIKHF